MHKWKLIVVPVALAALLGTHKMFGVNGARSITLAYIADLHAQLEEHPELFWEQGREEIAQAGGAARIAAAVEQLRRDRQGRVLFMDAGDTFQGSGPAAWTEGAVVVPALNALRLDLAVPGNWEVVYGKKALLERTSGLSYPMVAANVLDSESGKPVFAPFRMEEIDGVRVAVIGFTDPDVPTRQPPGYSHGLRYVGSEVLPPLIREVREREHADVVVLLTHVGLPKAVGLAEKLSGVDIVLSGDTHERTYEPIVRGKTWVVEPGSFGSFLGRLDLTFDDHRITDRSWQLIELRAGRFGNDPAVSKIVDDSLQPFRARMNQVIGYTGIPLMRYGVVNTSLDAVLSDAVREAGGTEIGLSNGFRFSAPIPAGPIRESDLWNAYPIVTPLKTGVVSGRQLHDFWERELENVFSSNPERLFGGWLPRPSGLTMRFAAHRFPGGRLLDLRINGDPAVSDRLYTISACEREGDAQDTLCRIPRVRDPKVLPVNAHEAVRRYLAKHSPLQSVDWQRLTAEDLPRVLRSQFMGQ